VNAVPGTFVWVETAPANGIFIMACNTNA
jgi:hypothetical protein